MIEKAEIRKNIRLLKTRIREDDKIKVSEVIGSLIESMPIFQSAKNILLYHSLSDEVFTHRMIRKWCKTKNIFLPKVIGDEFIVTRYVNDEDLEVGDFGILEPHTESCITYKKIDFAIIPAVAISLKGNRIGRGKGYYDRFLAANEVSHKVGIIYSFQLCNDFPADSHDIPMDYIITEKGIINI